MPDPWVTVRRDSSCSKPRGTAPGFTHPSLHSVAIHTMVKKAMQAGRRDRGLGVFSGVRLRHRARVWGGLTPGRRPGAHGAKHRTVRLD